jgi:hypothetical protein
LEALEQEFEFEEEAVPSYLQDSNNQLPEFVEDHPQGQTQVIFNFVT